MAKVISEDMRDEPFESKLDSCEPCYGTIPGERVCKWNEAENKSFCGCSDPMIEVKGKCVCPSGYIFDPRATLRKRCIDVCSMTEPSFCREGQTCVHTSDGVACLEDRETEQVEPVEDNAFLNAINVLLALSVLIL